MSILFFLSLLISLLFILALFNKSLNEFEIVEKVI